MRASTAFRGCFEKKRKKTIINDPYQTPTLLTQFTRLSPNEIDYHPMRSQCPKPYGIRNRVRLRQISKRNVEPAAYSMLAHTLILHTVCNSMTAIDVTLPGARLKRLLQSTQVWSGCSGLAHDSSWLDRKWFAGRSTEKIGTKETR